MGNHASKSAEERRILLLGAENAGKTTFAFQLAKTAAVTVSASDVKSYKPQIRLYILKAFKEAAGKMDKMAFKRDHGPMFKFLRILLEHDEAEYNTPSFVIQAIVNLAELGVFWKQVSPKDVPHLRYYSLGLPRIFGASFVPNWEDMLHCYIPTKERRGTELTLKDGRLLKLMEIAGTRIARKKWMHSATDFTEIVFLASAEYYSLGSEYEESVTFFETICSSRLFANCKISLVFSKTDLVEQSSSSDAGSIIQNLREKYFKVADRETPCFQVNLLNEVSSKRLFQSLF